MRKTGPMPPDLAGYNLMGMAERDRKTGLNPPIR